MSHEAPESFEDLFPPESPTASFLAAQSERIRNRSTIDGEPLVSTLSDAVEKVKTDVDSFIAHMNLDSHYGDAGIYRSALSTVQKNFMIAHRENQFYDPLDGDPEIGRYLDLDILNGAQKDSLYAVVELYYKYLTEIFGLNTQKKIGRHVLTAAKVHGRRAARSEDTASSRQSELQKG